MWIIRKNFWIFSLLWILLSVSQCFNANTTVASSVAESFNITTKNFQLNFLHDLLQLMDSSAQNHLNIYLKELHMRPEYAQHVDEFKAVEESIKVKHKIVFIKQLLDQKVNEGKTRENPADMQTLRNVIFLKKLKHHLYEMHEEKLEEMRQFRMFELCRQFKEAKLTYEHPFSKETILAPLETTANVVSTSVLSIDLVDFGHKLYEKVKYAGADIINDYMLVIRKLLHEVIEEKHEDMRDQPKISKLLYNIDGILKISDFYEKRQQLYAYLGHNLTADYEHFQNSEHSGQDLMNILSKLKQKGFDLFVNFLFSNFEFLEQLQSELIGLLKKNANGFELTSAQLRLDENAKQLLNIYNRFVDFKEESENESKYENYLQLVKELHIKTAAKPEFANVHIYELMHDSSENMGSVTLNMIRAKCAEL